MANYLESKLDEPEGRERCYWCEESFPESELELFEEVLVCEDCKPHYEDAINDE